MLISEANYAWALDILERSSEITVDTETNGVQVWQGDHVVGIAAKPYGEYAPAFYFPLRHGSGYNLDESCLPPLIAAMEGKRLVMYNAKFDMHMLAAEGLSYEQERVEDVMLAAHLMNENEPSYELKRLADKYGLGEGSRDEEELGPLVRERFGIRGRKKWKGHMWRLRPEEIHDYAISDIRLTELLLELYLDPLRTWGLLELWYELNEYTMVAARMEKTGIKVDEDMLDRYIAEFKKEYTHREKELQRRTGNPGLNPNSPAQLKEVFGWPATDRDTLQKIGTPEAMDVVLYRKYRTAHDRYFLPYKNEHLDPDSTLHPDFNTIGTVAGRWSCSRPNLQAVPRYSETHPVKDVFVARDGYELVEIDYSQAELRIGSYFAQERRMADILASGADLHGQTSTDIGTDRDTAKRINFSAMYGIGPKTFAETHGYTVQEARHYLEQYHQTYPGFRRLYYGMEDLARNQCDSNGVGYIRLPSGRIRRYMPNPKMYGEIEYHKASSNLIQGTVAEVIRIAMLRISRELPEVRMLIQVHDSVLVEVPAGQAEEWVARIAPLMTDFEDMLPDLYPPLVIEAKHGERWGAVRDLPVAAPEPAGSRSHDAVAAGS